MIDQKKIVEEFIDQFNIVTQWIGSRAAKFYQDKTNSLVDRWEVFCKLPSAALKSEPYIEHFDVEKKYGIEICWYDDFYKDRYATIVLPDIINSECDRLDDVWKTPFYKRLNDTFKIDMKQFLDDWKEEIMEKRLYSFINDW